MQENKYETALNVLLCALTSVELLTEMLKVTTVVMLQMCIYFKI